MENNQQLTRIFPADNVTSLARRATVFALPPVPEEGVPMGVFLPPTRLATGVGVFITVDTAGRGTGVDSPADAFLFLDLTSDITSSSGFGPSSSFFAKRLPTALERLLNLLAIIPDKYSIAAFHCMAQAPSLKSLMCEWTSLQQAVKYK